MSLVILTKNPKTSLFSTELPKTFLKIITNRKRGPSGVTSSLLRGLNELHHPHKLNPPPTEIVKTDTVWVNESLDALEWAIKFRRKFGKLIVGPNLVVTPHDRQEIITNNTIDILLQPSEWTKKFYTSLKPELEEKIALWPAGVMIPHDTDSKKINDVLIYSKNKIDDSLMQSIKQTLEENNLTSSIIHYGSFKQNEYFKLLKSSRTMIYLSHSESQGLALQEAWARNVPTLVYNRGYYKYGNYSFIDEKISAPYLTDQVGIFFDDTNFKQQFTDFWSRRDSFSPKKYVEYALSDKICAEKFLAIISGV